MTILISTIYKGSAVIQAIKLFNPNKVYFIVDDPLDDIRKNSIKMMKDIFPLLNFEMISTKIYDIVNIANKTIEVIKKESNEKIIIHISEGRKTMSLGLLFGAYVMRKNVDSAYYIIEETNVPIQLPLIELSVSPKKKEILKSINEGKSSVQELEKELKMNSATIYVHLKDLRDKGILSKENRLTEMGRIVLLNQGDE